MQFVRNYRAVHTEVNWEQLQNETVLVIPLLSDFNLHRCLNRISVIYIKSYISDLEYIVSCHHNDLDKCGIKWIQEVQWPPKSIILNSEYIDIDGIELNLINWIKNGGPFKADLTNKILKYTYWYRNRKNVVDSVPIVALAEYFQQIYEKSITLLNKSRDILINQQESLHFYNDVILRNFKRIENNGIPTNRQVLKQFHNRSDSKLYTHYNVYTATGRPSNAFGGINFAALNKSSGVRGIIERGNVNKLLVEFDYDSYHIRLVSKLLNYELPTANLHDYFGRMYFNTPVLTSEQYEESKGITFQMLYGYGRDEYDHIEFFKAVNEYKNRLWNIYISNGFIELPISKRRLNINNSATKDKNVLFNYLAQAYETELNGTVINKILDYLCTKNSNLILYTYDSFLFELSLDDGKIINNIKDILTENGMPVTLKIGDNYNNMKDRSI